MSAYIYFDADPATQRYCQPVKNKTNVLRYIECTTTGPPEKIPSEKISSFRVHPLSKADFVCIGTCFRNFWQYSLYALLGFALFSLKRNLYDFGTCVTSIAMNDRGLGMTHASTPQYLPPSLWNQISHDEEKYLTTRGSVTQLDAWWRKTSSLISAFSFFLHVPNFFNVWMVEFFFVIRSESPGLLKHF